MPIGPTRHFVGFFGQGWLQRATLLLLALSVCSLCARSMLATERYMFCGGPLVCAFISFMCLESIMTSVAPTRRAAPPGLLLSSVNLANAKNATLYVQDVAHPFTIGPRLAERLSLFTFSAKSTVFEPVMGVGGKKVLFQKGAGEVIP